MTDVLELLVNDAWLSFGGPFRNCTDAQVCPAGERPGPNDLMPCGTDDARRRHLAKAEQCDACAVSVDGPPPGLYGKRVAA